MAKHQRVNCPECGKSVGNLFLHQRVHAEKGPVAVSKTRAPFLEELMEQRKHLTDHLQQVEAKINETLQRMGLAFDDKSQSQNRVA